MVNKEIGECLSLAFTWVLCEHMRNNISLRNRNTFVINLYMHLDIKKMIRERERKSFKKKKKAEKEQEFTVLLRIRLVRFTFDDFINHWLKETSFLKWHDHRR